MSSIRNRRNLSDSQSGMVAVMVTLIMMVVISLIVIGFAQVTRRAQRNALDAQLSTQAFYAAESGVNDAAAIMKVQAAGGSIPAKTSCDDTAVYNFDSTGKSKLDGAGSGVSYTCVLIDPTPTKLNASVGANTSQVMRLKSAAGQFDKIVISWTPGGNANSPLANCPTGAGRYSPASDPTGTAQWTCKFGVVRAELTQTAGTLTRDGLMNNTNVFFLNPVSTASLGVGNWSTDNSKSIAASCTNTKCTAEIHFNGAGASSYYLHLNMVYQPTSITVSAKDAGNNDIHFSEAQVQVNATGKAQDVLRRILVAIPLDGDAMPAPNGAIISGDTVCKRFTVTNNSFSTEGHDGANGNPLCDADQDLGTPTNP